MSGRRDAEMRAFDSLPRIVRDALNSMVFGFPATQAKRALAAGRSPDDVALALNACRNVGYGVQVSALNYSRAEAAADISARSQPLPSAPCPTPISVPATPSSAGASVPPPLLWSVVQ